MRLLVEVDGIDGVTHGSKSESARPWRETEKTLLPPLAPSFPTMFINTAVRPRSKLLKRAFSATPEKVWNVYLSGEIHSDWRQVITDGVQSKSLPVKLTSPNTSHEDSDDCGAIILGKCVDA